MRLNYILSALSLTLIGFSIMVFLPIILAIYYKDFSSVFPFLWSGLISLGIGFLFKFLAGERQSFNDLRKKEGLFIVALVWISIAIITGLPFLFYGFSPLNALFEGVSGITTTGATIITDFSSYPKTMYFWRSLAQWLGGMGVIVLFIAILPQFAVAGRQMFFAEAPGPTEDKITPRIKYTAAALWGIYVSLTIIEAVILKHLGMPLFDAVCTSLSTISAGGLSPNSLSIAGYLKPSVIWVITFFMFLSGVNFALQYRAIVQRQFKALITNTEFLTYTAIFLGVSGLVTIALVLQNNYTFIISYENELF